jgi:hypothetical protein
MCQETKWYQLQTNILFGQKQLNFEESSVKQSNYPEHGRSTMRIASSIYVGQWNLEDAKVACRVQRVKNIFIHIFHMVNKGSMML